MATAQTRERPDVGELYTVATGGSNLRVEADRRTQADIVIAAGMSPHRLGLALLRLRSEWDTTPKPEHPTRASILALAATAPVLEKGEHKGKVPVQVLRHGATVTRYMLPAAWAAKERARWHDAALRELGMQLQSYALVHAAVTQWLGAGPENPPAVAAATLLHWLHPRCPVCMGRKRRAVEGTGRLSNKPCGDCHGTGQAVLPYAGWGRRAMSYVNDCTNDARKELAACFREQRRKGAAPQLFKPAPGAAPPRVQLVVGERWASRSGTLYDVLRQNTAGCYVCDIVGGKGQGARVLYWPDGRPVGAGPKELSQGDLVKRVREAPPAEVQP